MTLLLLGLLFLFPVVIHCYVKRSNSKRLGTVTGVSLGLIVAPASLGLYASYFLPYVGLVPGMIGLVSVLIHGKPGYEAAIALKLQDAHTIVGVHGSLVIALFNGVFWAVIYGTFGSFLDLVRRRRQDNRTKVC